MLNVIKTEKLIFIRTCKRQNCLLTQFIVCYIIIRIITLYGVTLLEIVVWVYKGGLQNKINE